MNIAELIARWNTDKGKPYKGSLIDLSAFKSDPENIGCMCAQGQVLHLIAGWSPERLYCASQSDADAETAKLLSISRAHAALLRLVNDSADGAPAIVLTDPGAVLGDKWSKLLDFWCHLDGMANAQWAAAGDAAWAAAGTVAGTVARDAAWAAAGTAVGDAALAAALAAAGDAAWAAAEIQGADIFRRDGRSFFFLPIFGFASPDDIPARPVNYGIAQVAP